MAGDDDTPATFPGRSKSSWAAIGDAIHDRIAGKIDERKTAHVAGILETFERDLQPLIAPFVKSIVDHPDTPAEVKGFLAPLIAPEHFSESIVISFAIGALMGPVLGSTIEPIVQGISNTVWPQQPNRPLTPDLLAAAVIKGVLSEGEASTTANVSGISDGAFHTMVMTAGQSIGTEEALLLLRRGQIDQAEFERIIRYSNVRNDFIPDVLALKYSPPPAGEVIAGALKAHLSDVDASKKLGEAGIDPTNFKWMKDTAGRPPGTEQVLHLWNREVVDEAFVDQAIAQSDINPNYLDAVKQLRHYYPPPRSLVPMLRAKSITEAQFRTWMSYYGAQPDVVDAFIKEATHTATSAAKDLTRAQVVDMYRDRFLTRAEAQTRLDGLGFPTDEIPLLLDYADNQRETRLINALIAQTGTLYVGHKIDRPAATTALDGAPVPSDVQADLFHLWDLERATRAPNLTVAQWQGSLRRATATRGQFDTAMQQFGYTTAETDLLAGLAFPPPPAVKGATPKDLTATQQGKLYTAGIIDKTTYLARLVTIGYSPAEAQELFQLTTPPDTGGA